MRGFERIGGVERSIFEEFASSVGVSGSLTFVDDALRPTRFDSATLSEHALRVAAALRMNGVRPGDRVCLRATTSVEMLMVLLGMWRLGAVPIVVAGGAHPGAVEHELLARVESAQAAAVIGDPETIVALRDRVSTRLLTLQDLVTYSGVVTQLAIPEADQLGLVQFTSGTTASPKAVPVRQGQIIGNISRCMTALGMRRDDVYLSWLPFFHDMGVVSVAGLLAHGLDIVVLATETFLRRPSSWMDAVSKFRATITCGPNSAYRLAARAQQLRPLPLDLSRLRVAINGAEPVTAAVIEESLPMLARSGLRPEAMCPTYGMAETTLVVTTVKPDAPTRLLPPGAFPDTGGFARPDRALPSCGRPLPDTEVVIRDQEGLELAEGAVGEVQVRGPGVMSGYWTPSGEPAPAGAVGVVDGWLHTGDLGFFHDGELYLCGRSKDMFIVGGRTLYAEDYESLAEQVDGVRAGNVIAFAPREGERMVVVAEVAGRSVDLPAVGSALLDRLSSGTEHAPEEVLLVRPGTLPKTTSGKRQRQRCRAQYEAGELAVTHTVR